ncbi:glycoprotease family protein-like protein [Xylariaceae sp. FL0016]|nr:glycoprotease family protein-like protein [Xylariaceae sp. FL0016]
MTLAIESSCDDTCVTLLEKDDGTGAARLLFNKKITSDNSAFRGVHPVVSVTSHTEHLAPLIRTALRSLPLAEGQHRAKSIHGQATERDSVLYVDGVRRKKPDFVSVTRGPGMLSNLSAGLNTAKGLALAWDVPLMAVNHMQAHALTPRLVSALEEGRRLDEERPVTPKGPDAATPAAKADNARQTGVEEREAVLAREKYTPAFPFLSLLVSGGHTLLLRSRGLNDHRILAQATNIAIGDMIDKCARHVVPPDYIAAHAGRSVMYGPLLERFAFPPPDPGGTGDPRAYDYGYTPPANRAAEVSAFVSAHGWSLLPPLAGAGAGAQAAAQFDFSGINGRVQDIVQALPTDGASSLAGRRDLARHAMRLVFEHLGSRVLMALKAHAAGKEARIKTLVVSGGVASNAYLRHILRRMLDVRGYDDVDIVCPPVALCTDNAAMIAWTGMEMYESGWRSSLDVRAIRKWPLDPEAEGGGILGADGWFRSEDEVKAIL